jgi:SAM-dependent methyltransferase
MPNRNVWESLVSGYSDWARQGLLEGERAILARLGDVLSGVRLLDIGVGAGRTAPAFSAACARYVGIDSAEGMIRHCRQALPDLDFRHCDARDLGIFQAASFDVVWFTFNGIDYVPPADRVRVLREMVRVLAPGGTLVFSSHNLNAPPAPPGLWPAWRTGGSLVRRGVSNVRRLGTHLMGHVNYRVRQRQQEWGEDHAFLVDTAHGYRLLTCFVSPPHQVARLQELGLVDVTVMAKDGTPVAADAGSADTWLFYMARKPS